ncbi:MAG: hypothetical protein ACJ8GJ_11535 [Vitreoscilla sp.]
MNQAANTIAIQSTNAVSTSPALPRRRRLAPAIASAVVTFALFGSVVLGMTGTGEGADQIVSQGHVAARA